jgi:DNA-binding CsgD family transcriptional regulator
MKTILTKLLIRSSLIFTGFIVVAIQIRADVPSFGIPQTQYFNRSFYNGGTQNWAISQAANGLIYVANNYGILEYDGSQFRLLPQISPSITRAVFVDGNRIYAAANDEFGYYEMVDGTSLAYSSLSKTHSLQAIGDFWGIFRLNEHIVFQSEKALCIYTPHKGVEVIYAPSRFPNAFLVNSMLFVHDELQGLMELRQGKLYRVLGGERFAGIRIGTILSLPNDDLIIGTMSDGLYKWTSAGIEKWQVPASNFLKENNIFCGIQIDDNLIFGTIRSGVVIADSNGQIKTIVNKDKGLMNNTVLGLYADADMNIWTGLDNGIAKIAYNSSISFIQGYYDIGTGYCATRFANNVYLGTNQGLYVIPESAFNHPQKDRTWFKLVEGTHGQVWSLHSHNNQLYCGHNTGIYKIENNRAKLLTPPSVAGAWIFRSPPSKPNIILAGTYKGLVKMESKNGTWVFQNPIAGFDESTRFMEWDTDGGLWIAHGLKGIFKLYFSDDYLKVTKIEQSSEFGGLPGDRNFTLSTIDNQVVFTSNQGIYQFDHQNKRFKAHHLMQHFTDSEGQYPYMISTDQYRNIWYFASNTMGVLRQQEDGTFLNISKPFATITGKIVNGFESVYSWDQKNVLFGIEDGFAHYSPADGANLLAPFSVHIREFRSMNDKLNTTFTTGYLQSLIHNQLHIPSYSFAQNAFDITVSATWHGSGVVEYATLLEGFDQNWSSWSDQQKRQVTRLPEGDYTFWVKARNMYGVETEPSGFQFIVTPPWYRTAWAKITYALTMVVAIVLVWVLTRKMIDKSRRREILKQQKQFKATEERLQHEALLNEKEMIRLRNEKLRNEMLHKEKELANSAMHVIQKNDFLIKIKEDLQKAIHSRDHELMNKRINQVVKRIDNDIDNESHWEVFETHLEQVHEDFLDRLQNKHSDLMPRELKLCAYLRMGMSSKEISSLMNISTRAVENNRYKLRKKLGLDQGDNLIEYIMNL